MEWYEAEVRQLEATRPKPDIECPAVFYGSSSIRLWETLAEDLGNPAAVNMGFGGSTLEACVYFFDRLIPAQRPASLVVYGGDNDLGDGRSPEQVLGYFRGLAFMVERKLGAIPFGFISIKGSPARFDIADRIRKANQLIRSEIAHIPSAYFIDILPAMLGLDGLPRAELFLEDGLHLSREGYLVWAQELGRYRNRIFIKNCREFDPKGVSFSQDESRVSQVVQPLPES